MSEIALPDGWIETKINYFVDSMVGGASPTIEDYSVEGVLALNKGDIKALGKIELKKNVKRVPVEFAKKHENKTVTAGATIVTLRDLSQKADFLGLISEYRDQEKALITQGMYALSLVPKFSKKYLIHYSNSLAYREQVKDVKVGVTQVHLRNEQFLDLYIPLPPLAEQQQIAQKLDELLAQVDTLKTRLDAIPNILKRFRQSVLAAAVSGRLTEGSEHWSIGKVGDIVEKIEAGKNLQCIETPPQKDQYGIVKISAVTWGIYNEEESKTLPDFDLFMESRRVQVGDFLISRANTIELLGNPVIVHRVTKNLMLSDKVLRLVMQPEDKYWLSIFLRSHFGRKQIEEKSTGNQMSMRNIGQKALLDIDIPKPPLEEQTEIVRRVEQLFAYADQIEQRVKDAQARVNHLTQSILAKAFRGELTAEWRAQNPELISGENSAAALLERIKAEREAAGKTKRKVKAGVAAKR